MTVRKGIKLLTEILNIEGIKVIRRESQARASIRGIQEKQICLTEEGERPQ
jgi:hypothetical protein